MGFPQGKYRNVRELKLLQVHQDAVIALPDDAVLLGHSQFTNHEIFSVGDWALCFQGHPEFEKLYVEQIIAVLRERPVDPKEVQAAVQSMVDFDPDNSLCADVIADFLGC